MWLELLDLVMVGRIDTKGVVHLPPIIVVVCELLNVPFVCGPNIHYEMF